MRPLLRAALVWFSTAPVFSQILPVVAPAIPKGMNIQQETVALVNAAMELSALENYQEALAKLARVKVNVNHKPFENIMLIEGICHYNMADFPKAIESFEDFVKEFPYSPAITDVRMMLGRSYIARKQDDKALAILNSVLADGFRSAEYLQAALLAAHIDVSCGKFEEAAALMNKLHSIAAGGGDILYEMKTIRLNGVDAWMERRACREALGASQVCRRAEISRSMNKLIPARKMGAP